MVGEASKVPVGDSGSKRVTADDSRVSRGADGGGVAAGKVYEYVLWKGRGRVADILILFRRSEATHCIVLQSIRYVSPYIVPDNLLIGNVQDASTTSRSVKSPKNGPPQAELPTLHSCP